MSEQRQQIGTDIEPRSAPDKRPPIGTQITQQGLLGPQRYELVAYRPAKGRRPVAIFHTHCAACGQPFECDNSKAGGTRYLPRRCAGCRRDSKQAKDGAKGKIESLAKHI